MKLYSIYDRVAGQFAPPFVSVNDQTAMRMFRATVQKDCAYMASDLDLFAFGEVDEKTGVYTPMESGKPEFLDRYEVNSNG